MTTRSKGGTERPGKTPEDQKKLVENIQKELGAGVITLGNPPPTGEGISTGSLLLDEAIGVGGVPRGRVTEIYGYEAVGKSTIGYHVMANAMKAGGTAAYIDVEHAMDPSFAELCGVQIDKVLISQPDSAEQALNVAQRLIESGQLDVVVLDSVAALVPESEIEGDIGKASVGAQARLMSQALRKMTASISKQRTAMVFINQVREKIGVTYGSPDVTSGGRALKYYASTRIDLRRIATIKKGDEVIGNRVRARVAKNKVARPWRQAEIEILHECGINMIGEIIDKSVENGSLRKNGSRYYHDEHFLANGRDNCRRALMDEPELLEELRDEVESQLAKPPDRRDDPPEAETDENENDNSDDGDNGN